MKYKLIPILALTLLTTANSYACKTNSAGGDAIRISAAAEHFAEHASNTDEIKTVTVIDELKGSVEIQDGNGSYSYYNVKIGPDCQGIVKKISKD